MMQIIICDNNATYANRCKDRINFLAEQKGINVTITIVESGNNLLFFKDTKFKKTDLIYIERDMPKFNGYEVATELRNSGVKAEIIFFTKDELHVADGYDVDALHYLIKDKNTQDKFDEVFYKAVKRYKKASKESISLSCAGEHVQVPLDDILYFEVKKRIVTAHYYDNDNEVCMFDFYSSLSKIEEFLFGKNFVRIHSSYLIGSKYIKKNSSTYVEMVTGEVLPVGKTYRAKLKKNKDIDNCKNKQ